MLLPSSGFSTTSADNIGRFGIGFVSTYQIADHPEIHSAGVKLTLFPEDQGWLIGATDEGSGTTFFLPWASDPTSKARVRLGASAATPEHIEELIEDFKGVLRRALLFPRHLKRAELRSCGAAIALAADDSFQRPSRMLYPKQPPEPQQLAVLQELSGIALGEYVISGMAKDPEAVRLINDWLPGLRQPLTNR
jgi:hypothetical protein